MKSKLAPILFFVMLTAMAQNDKMVEDQLLKVNALLPGVSYEFAVNDKHTLNLDLALGFGYRGGSLWSDEFGIWPGLAAEYRIFNNFERRLGKNKNISGNSGNYFGFLNQIGAGNPVIGNLELSSNYYYNVAVVYGIQRTRPKSFYWNIAFGPAVFIDEFDTTPGITVDIRLGWVINWKKRNR